MKTFNDLTFKPFVTDAGFHGNTAEIDFPNGYGLIVAIGEMTDGGSDGLYEIAIMLNGKHNYSNPIADDNIGWLTPDDITACMISMQNLESPK